jgi:ADP-heptose:LPS heptosyltransferase
MTARPRARLDRRVSDAVRDLAQRSAAALCPGPRIATAPDWDARPYRVLVVRTGSMGDTVIVTALIRAIAASHRTLEVDALVRAPYVRILDGLPYIHEVVPFECGDRQRNPGPALMARLRHNRYDVVVDGMINVDTWGRTGFPSASIMFLLAAGAPLRIGQGGMRNSYIMNLPVTVDRDLPQIDRFSALAGPFGVDGATTNWRPELALSPTERAGAEARWSQASAGADGGFRLLVNVSAQERIRQWQDDRYAAVIRHARERRPGLNVVVTGVPDQEARIAAIAAAGGAAWSTQPMRDALALCAAADAVLTPDTGMTHVASAFSRPTVVMRTPEKWMWAPYRVPSREVIAADNRSLDTIAAPSVADALDGLLDEVGAPK